MTAHLGIVPFALKTTMCGFVDMEDWSSESKAESELVWQRKSVAELLIWGWNFHEAARASGILRHHLWQWLFWSFASWHAPEILRKIIGIQHVVCQSKIRNWVENPCRKTGFDHVFNTLPLWVKCIHWKCQRWNRLGISCEGHWDGDFHHTIAP